MKSVKLGKTLDLSFQFPRRDRVKVWWVGVRIRIRGVVIILNTKKSLYIKS